ncbi:MAG: hypothetical protein INR71_10930, partial [Terriglobus roseus]|nr:hypothetical protein [Terriglobus roseus]
STQLGRAILARYHEEQVWSDKIRQMSTWGTWGLMGLNVLLFVVFQIMIEPWRRRRLVRGFEEKVELALQERDAQLAGLRDSVDSHAAAAAATAVAASTPGGTATETHPPASAKAETVAETIAEQVADAVSGASPTPADLPVLATSHPEVDAAEGMTTSAAELVQEGGDGSSSTTLPAYPSPQSSVEGLFASTASGYAYYAEAFRELWNEDRTVVVTQREMTTHVLEGAVGGAALMGLLMALLRPR